MTEANLQQNFTQGLDINEIENAIDVLLVHYGMAIKAVELLPMHGRVPVNEIRRAIPLTDDRTLSLKERLKAFLFGSRTRNADWITSRFANRSIARFYLRSHIRSRLQTVAKKLETEWLAGGNMDAGSALRLDIVIKKLRDYDIMLAQKKTVWWKLAAWIWTITAPVVSTYLSTLWSLNSQPTVSLAAELFIRLATYLLFAAVFVVFPLYTFGILEGFRWKRLILVGQAGDVNIDISANAVLRWVPAPRANTYQFEGRLFEMLGITKRNEFPWDLWLSPDTFWSAALALAILLVGLAFIITTTKLDWGLLIGVLLIIVSSLIFLFVKRRVSRAMEHRKARNAC